MVMANIIQTPQRHVCLKTIIHFLFAITLLSLFVFPVSADSNLSAIADTYIIEYAPTTNAGSADYLIVSSDATNRDIRMLMKFNTYNYNYSSARLYLYYYSYDTGSDPFGRTIQIYNIDADKKDTWVETQATWNNYKTGTAWAVSGGDYSGSSVNAVVPSSFGWMNVDITSLTSQGENTSILLKDEAEESDPLWYRVMFRSAEYEGGFHPYLILSGTYLDNSTYVITTNKIFYNKGERIVFNITTSPDGSYFNIRNLTNISNPTYLSDHPLSYFSNSGNYFFIDTIWKDDNGSYYTGHFNATLENETGYIRASTDFWINNTLNPEEPTPSPTPIWNYTDNYTEGNQSGGLSNVTGWGNITVAGNDTSGNMTGVVSNVSGRISGYNYTTNKNILTIILPAVFETFPSKVWAVILLKLALIVVLMIFKR